MIFWFRNDLRTHDNPALRYFIDQTVDCTERKAFFFITEKQWDEHDWAPIKIDFIKRHAAALVIELKALGVDLQLITVLDFESQATFIDNYCTTNGDFTVVANGEVEYNEQRRDKSLAKKGIDLRLFESDVVVPKGKVLNQSGHMFKVFTPFKRAWLKYVRENGFDYEGKIVDDNQLQLSNERSLRKSKSSVDSKRANYSLSEAWPLSTVFERDVLPLFYQQKLHDYHKNRDIPSIKGTSGLSPYLAAGVISPRAVLMTLLTQFPDILLATDSAEFSWLNELIWREFYRHLLFHEQRLCKHQCFNEKYQSFTWPAQQNAFDAWCAGKTGYPIVDAAMRQLNQTGWMHNRLRMVVASFLTKHLLIDWRQGERYFMKHLIDGDLASNNGGWQWAASTGCDAQPYFRIFNPIRQSERFDPNGKFIRKYIPELNDIPDKKIHFPHQYINENKINTYWPAIVEHKEARIKALAFYKV
ncbi:cryptochrome/photolyase family protein [Thalassotalea atypica]|uniref:cryptochrome/photolyase family protein n=1 Tax=Thalassotalea atypica TaxID=2054316 RepID=UPI0025746DD1|nr:FAD-binding domain-containing protein [Thalassotalea atypica]